MAKNPTLAAKGDVSAFEVNKHDYADMISVLPSLGLVSQLVLAYNVLPELTRRGEHNVRRNCFGIGIERPNLACKETLKIGEGWRSSRNGEPPSARS